MFTQAQEVIDFIEKEEIAYIDVRFCDLPGVQQHFTIPASELQASVLKDGLMFDGSSVRGFTQIHESDMKLIPDITSAFVDPFRANKTLVIIFSIVDPFTDEPFSRDPRQVAAKAEAYLRSTGIADTCYIGAEAEFFVFNDVRYQVNPQSTFYALDSDEAYWNTGRTEEGGNLGYKVAPKGGYFPVSPSDDFTDLRDEMSNLLTEVGLKLERAHHEVGSGGQQEINYRFDTLSTSLRTLRAPRGCRQPSCPSLYSVITVRECTPTCPCGRTASLFSMTNEATVLFPTPLAGSLVGFWSTRLLCLPSQTPRSIPSADSSPALRHRLTWSIRHVTVAPVFAFP